MQGRYDHELLQSCAQLHMVSTGAMAVCSQDMEILSWLRSRMAYWSPSSNPATSRVDNAIRHLCLAVIGETEERMGKASSAKPAEPAAQSPVLRVHLGENSTLPAYKTAGASGLDLAANEWKIIPPGGRARLTTGIRMAIPVGYEGQVRPRSGLTLSEGLVAAFGTVDADYRGEVCVTLFNFSSETKGVNRGDRIAQLVIAPVAHVAVEQVAELDATERGDGGFGSTGR